MASLHQPSTSFHPFIQTSFPKVKKPFQRAALANQRCIKTKLPNPALINLSTLSKPTMRYPLAPYAIKPVCTWAPFFSCLIDTVAVLVKVRHKALSRIAENNPNVRRDGNYLLSVKSAFSRKVTARVFSRKNRETLYIEASIPKFLTGQNIVGREDLHEPCVQMILEVLSCAGIKATPEEIAAIQAGQYTLVRVDHAVHCDTGSPERGAVVMSALRSLVFAKAKAASAYGNETIYVQQHSSRWTLRIYRKDLELKKRSRQLPANVYGRQHLLAKVEGCVRLELTLRAPELKRLGLTDPMAWNPDGAHQRMKVWTDRLSQLEGRVPGIENIDSLSNLNQLKLRAWLLGDHCAFSRTPTTVTTSRKEILRVTGIDVRGEPNIALQSQAITCVRHIFQAGIGFKNYASKWAKLCQGVKVSSSSDDFANRTRSNTTQQYFLTDTA